MVEELRNIFNPFYTTKPVGHGTGLGLSMANDIVKKYNGEIQAVFQVAQGATFTILFSKGGVG